MTHGITKVCIASLYAAPAFTTQMVSQLLFGELFNCLTRKKNWIQIQYSLNETAWVHQSQINLLTQHEYEQLVQNTSTVTFDTYATGITSHEHIPLVLGSYLPFFDGLSFTWNTYKVVYNGQVLTTDATSQNETTMRKLALKYLNAPFLAGGLSPFGIDNCGLVYMIYRLVGITLPRFISAQMKEGKPLSFFSEAKFGDLIFLNDKHNQEHVGLYLGEGKLLHTVGKVQIDAVDSHGVYNMNQKGYSYKLNDIRRIANITV